MTKLQMAKIIAVLMASDQHGKLTMPVKVAYEESLEGLDYAAVNAAVASLLVTSKWLPTPAEIAAAVATLDLGEVRPGGDAWGSVRKAIAAKGHDRRPGVDFDFHDPIVLQAVLAFGWRDLCDSEHMTADRARFIELYDKLAAISRRSALTEALPAVQRYRQLQERAAKALPRGETRSLADIVQHQPALRLAGKVGA